MPSGLFSDLGTFSLFGLHRRRKFSAKANDEMNACHCRLIKTHRQALQYCGTSQFHIELKDIPKDIHCIERYTDPEYVRLCGVSNITHCFLTDKNVVQDIYLNAARDMPR
jgi:hypothetical protein